MLDTLRRFKASIFRTLGHPVRIGIVEYLQYGEQSVERLCEKLAVDEGTLAPYLEALRK
jgi:Bacterial regulatory protein, arsR family